MVHKPIRKQGKIARIEATSEKISGRGGLLFFLRYLENIEFYHLLQSRFDFIKGSKKGFCPDQLLKQLFAFYIDGSDMAISGFDRRKGDEAYAALLESSSDQMVSSHQVKRFFRKFLGIGNWLFRCVLLCLFMWRLRVEQPEVIVLFGDSMVLDNDGAQKRQGVEPTYKRKKGFHPLQISWGPYVVDALFRSGSAHSNHGSDFVKAVARLVHAIRKKYRDVPIIVLTDSGFLDGENFCYFEDRLHIHYACVGKLYEDIKAYLGELPDESFAEHGSWRYVEFGNRLKSWSKFRRCIFTAQQSDEHGQLVLQFARPETVLYTNIGQHPELDQKLIEAGGEDSLKAETIIDLDHGRGRSELVHRSQKEFATKEQLPFERMGMNRAYYYFLLLSHFLYEAYKRDITFDVLPVTSYPTTFRRLMIDFAAKIVSTSGQWVLRVHQSVINRFKLQDIWQRLAVLQPIPI